MSKRTALQGPECDCTTSCKGYCLRTVERPVVCLPLMTQPAREVEKGTKYLPEVWKPNG